MGTFRNKCVGPESSPLSPESKWEVMYKNDRNYPVSQPPCCLSCFLLLAMFFNCIKGELKMFREVKNHAFWLSLINVGLLEISTQEICCTHNLWSKNVGYHVWDEPPEWALQLCWPWGRRKGVPMAVGPFPHFGSFSLLSCSVNRHNKMPKQGWSWFWDSRAKVN